MRQLRQGEVVGGQVMVGGHLPGSEGTPGRAQGRVPCGERDDGLCASGA